MVCWLGIQTTAHFAVTNRSPKERDNGGPHQAGYAREGKMTKNINTKPKQPKRPHRMRREYGIGDFLDYIHSGGGLVNAVKKIQKEEQMMLNFDPAGKPVN